MNWSLRYAAWKTKFLTTHYAVPFTLDEHDIEMSPENLNNRTDSMTSMRWKFHNPVSKWNKKNLPPISAIQTVVTPVSSGLSSYIMPLSSKNGRFSLEEPLGEFIMEDSDLSMGHNHTDHDRAHVESLRNFIHNYRGLLHEPTEMTDWEE